MGKLWDTLSLMKASMTACQRAEVLYKEHMIYSVKYSGIPHCSVCSDLVVVHPDQAVDLIVGCGLGVRVAVFSQSFACVPVASQPLLIQMNVDRRVQLENIKTLFYNPTVTFMGEFSARNTFFNSSFVCLK